MLGKAGLLAARAEFTAALEPQRNSTETSVEFFSGNSASSRGRIIEQEIVAIKAFKNDKMTELPE